MKKKITCALLAMMLVTLPACGKSTSHTQPEVSSAVSESVVEEMNQTDTLVLYFSRADNSNLSETVDATSAASFNDVDGTIRGDARILAETAAAETGGDLVAILTEATYPEDEAATYNQVRQEQVDGTVPSLKTKIENLDQYKNVILVYPNWLGTVPAAVTAFLDENDLSHKKLLPICSYDATGLDATLEAIEAHTKAKVQEPLEIRGKSATTSGTRTAVKKFVYDSGVRHEK